MFMKSGQTGTVSRVLLVLTLLPAMSFLVGCAGVVSGNSNSNSNTTPTLSLTITPSSASFGDVTPGSPSSQTIKLANTGTGALTISQVTVTGTGFSISSLTLPLALPAGQSITFNVQFAPTTAGTATGTITIASNAPNSPETIALSGTGVAPSLALSFSPTTLGFGNVTDGTSSTLTETVTNTGNGNVQISKIAESGTGFTLSGASTPVTLTPNQTTTFKVTFSPTAAGNDSGSVTVTSTAAGSPGTIALSGVGVQATASHTATLSWTASTSTVSGYNVYRSTTSGSGYAKISGNLIASLTYVDSTVQSATTYYYVVTAVDGSGNESSYSNSAPAVVP